MGQAARSTKPGLSHDRVVVAAEQLVKRSGLEALSLRALAESLDVTPMALYRHVGGIEDIVNELVERTINRTRISALPGDADWRDALEWLGRTYIRLLSSHPLAVRAYLQQPVTTARLRSMAEPVLSRLKGAGFSDDGAVVAYRSVLVLTVGFASLRQKWTSTGDAQAERVAAVAELIRSAGEAEDLSTLTALAPALASPYLVEHYHSALKALIAGLQPEGQPRHA